MCDYLELDVTKGKGVERQLVAKVKISLQDASLIGTKCWMGGKYPTIYRNGTATLLHRHIMQPPSDKLVDHKDHDPLKATRENLRICDYSLNNHNRKRDPLEIKKSIYTGVRKEKNFFYAVLAGKIVAKCQTEDQAAACYNAAATVKYGHNANLNLNIGLIYSEIPNEFKTITKAKGKGGSVSITPKGNFAASYKRKYLGTFVSMEEARNAIEIEKLRLQSIPIEIIRNSDGVALLPCSESFVMVDDDVYLQFHRKKLAIDFAGYPRTGGALLHRVVMGATKGQIVDHCCHNLLDARRQSLRIVTRSQNCQNRVKKDGATSQYFGVSKKKTDRLWVAQVRASAQERVRMYFETELEAAKWYDSEVVNYYGPNARKNFSDLSTVQLVH